MITLPVSLGEAIDKLTILDIKCSRIKHAEDSKREYEMLYDRLKEYVTTYKYQYTVLRLVNEEIWDMQDEIRSMAQPDGAKCIDILNRNDMRFRIKDTINKLASSHLREQKGYPKRRALFFGHLGLGDHIGLNGAVRYVALQYDEVVLPVKHTNYENVKAMFSDNPSIRLLPIQGNYTVYPTSTNRGELFEFNTNEYTAVYRTGLYTHPRHDLNELPHCFYRDMGVDPEIRHTYFHIPKSNASLELYAHVKDMKYIFTQQKSSTSFCSLVSWNKDEICTIDPNHNVYNPGHAWYDLAQLFINKPFLDYIDVIENAEEIHTVDSSFYCLACYLTLKAKVKRCYSRDRGILIPSYTFN
jgi:hypothetical protein